MAGGVPGRSVSQVSQEVEAGGFAVVEKFEVFVVEVGRWWAEGVCSFGLAAQDRL